MKSILNRNNWLVVKIIIFSSIIIPAGIVAYELVILGKKSVVFLGEYPTAVGTIILIYYSLLLVAGILWVIMQLKSFMNLKNETKKNELRHLQNQVNPHFFFNMLNNIYGMVDKDSNKAKILILKLSDLMRYSIYEGEKSTVLVKDEVDFLKNYIDLHKLRYHKAIDIKFNTDIEKDVAIIPLLLIILVENAFKHGVEKLRENAYIHLSLKANSETLIFEIENNFDAEELPKENGIGLNNLKRRLDLVYPKRHKLELSKTESIYKAYLEMQL